MERRERGEVKREDERGWGESLTVLAEQMATDLSFCSVISTLHSRADVLCNLYSKGRHICETKLVIIAEAPASSNHWKVFLPEI